MARPPKLTVAHENKESIPKLYEYLENKTQHQERRKWSKPKFLFVFEYLYAIEYELKNRNLEKANALTRRLWKNLKFIAPHFEIQRSFAKRHQKSVEQKYKGDKNKAEIPPEYLDEESNLEKPDRLSPVFSINATAEEIAHRIKAQREARGWSQVELARRMGRKSGRAVENLEDPAQSPSLASIHAAMEALEITEL